MLFLVAAASGMGETTVRKLEALQLVRTLDAVEVRDPGLLDHQSGALQLELCNDLSLAPVLPDAKFEGRVR